MQRPGVSRRSRLPQSADGRRRERASAGNGETPQNSRSMELEFGTRIRLYQQLWFLVANVMILQRKWNDVNNEMRAETIKFHMIESFNSTHLARFISLNIGFVLNVNKIPHLQPPFRHSFIFLGNMMHALLCSSLLRKIITTGCQQHYILNRIPSIIIFSWFRPIW